MAHRRATIHLSVAVIVTVAVGLGIIAQADEPGTISFAALQQPEYLPAPIDPDTVGKDDASDDKPKDDLDKLMSMDLDQLQKVDVVQEATPAALTEVPSDRNIVPAAVTHISKEDIWRSGARNLDELLEIFVPNLQVNLHHWEQQHLGLRGIIGDRDSKYLLLVNDRIMNELTHYGAATERLLPELDDINHIDVVRGPGSNIYGPGAVSMVIAIYTDTAETFTGTTARLRGGMVDSFTSLELKRGHQWKDAEGGILLYGGIGSVDGANQSAAPFVFGTSDPGWPGFGNLNVQYQDYVAGTDSRNPQNRYGQAFQNNMPLKFFADVIYEDFEVWARYTRSGMQWPMSPSTGLHFPAGFGTFVDQFQAEAGNQQATIQSKYETDWTEDTRLIATLGFDHSEFARNLFFGTAEAYAEEELNTRAVFITTLGEHQLAYGGEFYNNWFGLPSHLLDEPPIIGRLGTGFKPWTTQTYSILGEDQWQINDEWTTFLGGRWDKNSYTRWMYSPRAAVVYTPSEQTAWKLMANRSQRMNFAEELRAQWLATGTLGEPEILRSYELRLERQPTEELFWAVSTFYIDLDAITWDNATSSAAVTGNQTQWGMEGELTYRSGCWMITGSHSYVKLLKFTLLDPTAISFISAAPEGFGNDLNVWSNHITKLFIHRQINETWSTDASLRYYWGFPGSRDIQDRNNATPDAFGQTAADWNRPYEDGVFLNLGLEYRLNRHVRIRADGYNLLGILQSDLNRRPFGGEGSFYSEATALGLSADATY
jgi:iron complex outermembrane receptor protein